MSDVISCQVAYKMWSVENLFVQCLIEHAIFILIDTFLMKFYSQFIAPNVPFYAENLCF